MLVLNAQIQIGSYLFTSVHEVQISKSIFSLADYARIVLPASAGLQYNNQLGSPTVSLNSRAAICNEGDTVQIKLGYNNALQTEFTGFIKKLHYTKPLVIECEGYSWLLRNRNQLFTFSYTGCSLKTLLQQIADSFPQISVSPDTEDIEFGPLAVAGASAASVLEHLRSWGFTLYFINGNTLYAGLQSYTGTLPQVNLQLGWNTLKEDALIYRNVDETKISVALSYKDDEGKTQHALYSTNGTGAQPKKYRLPFLIDEATRGRFVNAYARQYTYTGYEGALQTFLQPYAQHAFAANLSDPVFPELNGQYLIESMDLYFGQQGARRTLGIGSTLTPQEELVVQS